MVHFNDRRHEERDIAELNEAIKRFLSPWAYEGDADIEIGGRIYANSLLDFVDRQPSVDFVEALKFLTSTDGSQPTVVPQEGDGGYVVKGQADQVLVTAEQHQIVPFFIDGGEGGVPEGWPTGIGHMTVGLDFILDR